MGIHRLDMVMFKMSESVVQPSFINGAKLKDQ